MSMFYMLFVHTSAHTFITIYVTGRSNTTIKVTGRSGVIGSDVPWLECPACNALTWVITVTE